MAKNKGLIKALATEITTPNAPTSKGARIYNTRLNAQSANDPIQNELDLDISPDIRHGSAVLIIRTNRIVDHYMTPAEQLEAQRAQNGGETNLEIYKDNVLAAQHLIEISHQATPTLRIVIPSGHTAGQTLRGNDGKSYTAVLDSNGKVAYYDTGSSCVMEKAAWEATTYTHPNDDLLSDAKKQEITHKYDKDGKLVERTEADRAIQLVLARQDVKYTELPFRMDMIDRITREVSGSTAQNDPSFTTAAGSGIKANDSPTAPFDAAATGKAPVKSIMFKTAPANPAPWDKLPANEPKLEIGA